MTKEYFGGDRPPRLTPEGIRQAVTQGRVSYDGHGISPEAAGRILEENIDRFCHPENFRIDLTGLFPEH